MTVTLLRELPERTGLEYNVALVYMQTVLMEGEPPYYPMMFLVMDRKNGMIVTYKIIGDLVEGYAEATKALLECLINYGKPSRIYGITVRTCVFLQTICEQLGIPWKQDAVMIKMKKMLETLMDEYR